MYTTKTIGSSENDICLLLNMFRKDILSIYFNRQDKRDNIEYVILEAIDNACEHGNGSDERKKIHLSWQLTNEFLTVTIEDEGNGFDTVIPDDIPPLSKPRGRGLYSMREYADDIYFNTTGNKVTVSFTRETKHMAEVIVSEGRVCIIKVEDVISIKDALEGLKNGLIDFTTSEKVQDSPLDTFLFVDLSPFNIINSSLIGIFGSIIMDKKVQLLGLCNVQPAVKDILVRFGVLSDDGMGKEFASDAIKSNISKVVAFDSIEDGLISLNS